MKAVNIGVTKDDYCSIVVEEGTGRLFLDVYKKGIYLLTVVRPIDKRGFYNMKKPKVRKVAK